MCFDYGKKIEWCYKKIPFSLFCEILQLLQQCSVKKKKWKEMKTHQCTICANASLTLIYKRPVSENVSNDSETFPKDNRPLMNARTHARAVHVYIHSLMACVPFHHVSNTAVSDRHLDFDFWKRFCINFFCKCRWCISWINSRSAIERNW